MAAVVFGFFAAVSIISLYQGGGVLWVTAGFGIFAAGSVAGVMDYRGDTELNMGPEGVQLCRASRVRKRIPWGEMVKVRFGTRVIPMGGYHTHIGPFLEVKGRRFRDHVDFDGSSYLISDFEVAEFSAMVAREAEARGIRVERKDVRTPRRR